MILQSSVFVYQATYLEKRATMPVETVPWKWRVLSCKQDRVKWLKMEKTRQQVCLSTAWKCSGNCSSGDCSLAVHLACTNQKPVVHLGHSIKIQVRPSECSPPVGTVSLHFARDQWRNQTQ